MQIPWPIEARILPGVGGRFAVADLRHVRIEEMGMPAELRHAGFEGVAGPGRFVEEQQKRRLMRQQQRRFAAMELFLQFRRPCPAAGRVRRG